MRKSVIAVLSCVAVTYVLYVGIDATPLSAPGQLHGESVESTNLLQDRSASTSNKQIESEIQSPSNFMLTQELAQAGSEISIDFQGHNSPLPTTDIELATLGDQDDKLAEFLRLVDYNTDQLHFALWQTLNDEDLDDVDFQAFVLATLEDMGDQLPGEIIAALVQTAPTSALRLSALRLLSEASQELSLGSFSPALDHQDPQMRQFAQSVYDELSANALLGAVATAVQDRNHAVRMAAFTTLEDMSEFAPVWQVANSVLDDPDPQIRMRALELLTYGDHQTATDRLVLALSDPNPDISNLAGDLLTGLEEGRS